MKKLIILITALALSVAAHAQEPLTYQDHMNRAGVAYEANDWATLNDELDAAQSSRPYSLYVYRNRILARMLADREDDALELSSDAAVRGLSFELAGHPALERLTTLPEFAPIAVRMRQNLTPYPDVVASTHYDRRDLLPEAIAYDKKKNAYIGSVRSGEIFKAPTKGGTLSRVAAAQGGVFDIEIRGDTLWVAVNNQLAYEGADPEKPFASVMAFNLKTGAIKREIRITDDAALLGDLEVAKDGTVYASDSLTPRIYRMQPNGQTLDIFADDPRFANLQGIALDEKNHRLFVADYLTGLFVVDTRNGTVTALTNKVFAHLGGIDGLYLYNGGLIGIQNGTTPQRIVFMGLDDAATAVETFISMQSNVVGWNEPTHGAIVDKEFRYIATSNWPSYDSDWNVRDGADLLPLQIMTLPLESP